MLFLRVRMHTQSISSICSLLKVIVGGAGGWGGGGGGLSVKEQVGLI